MPSSCRGGVAFAVILTLVPGVPLGLAAAPLMGTVFSEQFNAANSSWDKSTSGGGDFQVANGRLEFSAQGGPAGVASYVQNQAEFNFETNWAFSTAFSVPGAVAASQKVEAFLGMQFGELEPSYNAYGGQLEGVNGFCVGFGRDGSGFASSAWQAISSAGAGDGNSYFGRRVRRAPAGMAISYNASKDRLTLSAGGSTVVIRNVHDVVAEAGFVGDPRLYVAAAASDVDGEAVVTFDNTEFRAAPRSPRSRRMQLERSLVSLRESQGAPWGITVPGLAAAVVTQVGDRQQVVDAASGWSRPAARAPLEPSGRFHVGSVTKTFTAALVMQLAQEGKLSLGDPISRWIEFPGGDGITVRMLLGHTSGIQGFDELPGHARRQSPAESIALAAAVPPLFAPGSSWAYSNTNYTILGVIAERATGSTWESELRVRFFRPLGLHDTYVWSGRAKGPTVSGSRLSCGLPGEPECIPQPGFALVAEDDGFDWTVSWAAGALVSTPADIGRWMCALVSGKVVDKEHLDLMVTPTPESVAALAALPKFGSLRWTGEGLGLMRYEVDGVGTGYGHGGLINGFSANVAYLPATGTTVALTANFQQINSMEALGDLIILEASSSP